MTFSRTILLKSLILAGACTLGVAHANLLTNGSFETGSFTDQGDDTDTFTAGATNMTGWTTVGNYVSWIGPANPFSIQAQSGSYFLDLTGYQAGAPFGGVSQTVGTAIGGLYTLTFYFGSDTALYGGPESIKVTAGSASQVFSLTAPTNVSTWTQETFSFTATAATTTITLLGTDGYSDIGLDNVDLEGSAVAAVPEPGSYALMLAGLGVIATLARRRQRGG